MFGRRKFTAPAGLNTAKQRVMQSVPFVFDNKNLPAFSMEKLDKLAKQPQHDKLLKGQRAGEEALKGLGLRGLRMQVIVILDGSGSMTHDYHSGKVQRLLVRTLGFALNLDADGEIPVIVYGYNIHKPVMINTENYLNAPRLVPFEGGGTPMTEAFIAALKLAATYNMLTMIVNITDGDPNNQVTMSNEIIRSSGLPILVKNMALRPVPYLKTVDTLPSQIEVEKDANDEPVYDGDHNLVLVQNPDGIRLIDNVSSVDLDPDTADDDEFATKFAAEIDSGVELMGRVGILTGVPGITQTYHV